MRPRLDAFDRPLPLCLFEYCPRRAALRHTTPLIAGLARHRSTTHAPPSKCTSQKQEELQFAVGAAVADLACSGPLRVPAGKLLEDMRASALAARRDMTEEKTAQGAGGAVIDALDYVLYQVGDDPCVPRPPYSKVALKLILFLRGASFLPLGLLFCLER